jgi:CDP-glucose 4,6-dehydratase
MPHVFADADFADFYRGKRVLVSGHTGFAGGWLAVWLKLLGAQVSGYGSPPATRPNFFDATLLDRGMTSIFGDLRDRAALANLFAEFQPEILIHYTAQVSPQRARLDPVEAFATNVMGTVHILEEGRHIDSVRAVVIANSNQCYENRNAAGGAREPDPLGGHDPYSSSAACVELAASAYIAEFFRSTNTAVATARTGNVIGGGDWAEGELVPDIVRGITSAEPIVIEQGSSVGIWQHVLEPVRAQLLLAQKLHEQGQEFSGPWNLGPRKENSTTVRQLAESFVKQWGAGELLFDPDFDPDEDASQPVVRLNTQKAQTHLNWKPALPLEDAIAWTVEWYKSFYADPASSWRTTEDQIQRFMRCSGS